MAVRSTRKRAKIIVSVCAVMAALITVDLLLLQHYVYYRATPNTTLMIPASESPKPQNNHYISRSAEEVNTSNEGQRFVSEMLPHPTSLRDPHSPWQSEACRSFVGDTFHKSFKVCQKSKSKTDGSSSELYAKQSADVVTCYRTSGMVKMATCVINELAVNCSAMLKAMQECNACRIPQSGAVWLLNHKAIEAEVTCSDDGFKQLESCTEGNDFIRPYVNRLIDSVKHPASTAQECDKYVRGRTHMFMLVDPCNIYFATLAYYNIFKSMLDFSGGSLSHTNDTVFRLSTHVSATPIDFDTEHKLFPNFKTVSEFSGNVCFEQAVLIPRAFSATPFRCKMDSEARRKCQECDGRNIESSFVLFKKHVLKACNTDKNNNTSTSGSKKKLVFVSRKPYIRFEGDEHSKFQRVLANSEELIRALKEKFPNTDINVVHLEEFSFCEQVKLARGADVYMGVHGAGLVHLWWMQSDAVIIELEPSFTSANPTFKTLSKLLGQPYHDVPAQGSTSRVTVDVNSVVTKVKSVTPLT